MDRGSTTRDVLVQAAAQELWGGSYGSVGVGALCEAAGVKRGSFYHFFPSKDDLVLAALDHLWERYRERMDAALESQDVSALGSLQRLFGFIAELLEEKRAETGEVPGCPFGNLGVELGTTNEAIRSRVAEIFDENIDCFTDFLRRARDQGEVTGSDADLRTCARELFAYLQGAMVLAKAYADPDLVRSLAPGAIALAQGTGEAPSATTVSGGFETGLGSPA